MLHEQKVNEFFGKLSSPEAYPDWQSRSFQVLVEETVERLNCGPKLAQERLLDSSRRLLGFWFSQANTFLQAESEDRLDNEGWLRVANGEKVRVRVQEIEGPIDVTELTIRRATPTEKSKFTMAIDEDGQLEYLVHPPKVSTEFFNSEGDVTKTCEITFDHGLVSRIEVKEYLYDEDYLSSTRETKIDHSYVARKLQRSNASVQVGN